MNENDAKELSGRQRFEMALLCVNAEEYECGGALASLVRFVAAEGIVPDQFDDRDRFVLNLAYTAALMVSDRQPITRDCLAARVLCAASIDLSRNDTG